MKRAVLVIATDKGVSILKPGEEATNYTLSARGLVDRKCTCLALTGESKIITGTENFFIQTSKDGSCWTAATEGVTRPNITALAQHPKLKHIILAGSCPPAVFTSSNYGSTWQQTAPLEELPSASQWGHPEPPYRAKISSIAIHSEHEGVIFCSVENGGVVASMDGGRKWSKRDLGLPSAARTVLFPPKSTTQVYAATKLGFFRSEDLGGTWTSYNKGLPYHKIISMAVAASNPQMILLSIQNETSGNCTISLSSNGGQSWATANSGLPRLDNRKITGLTFASGGFYAASDQGEIFWLNNLEGRWTQVAASYPPIKSILAIP